MRDDKKRKDYGNLNGSRPGVRCGIYTRKSTEEGLEQSFNTLDAQREAAESFIISQRQEGEAEQLLPLILKLFISLLSGFSIDCIVSPLCSKPDSRITI